MTDLLARLVLGPLVPALLTLAGAGLVGRALPHERGARWLAAWWVLSTAAAFLVFELTLCAGAFRWPVVAAASGALLALGAPGLPAARAAVAEGVAALRDVAARGWRSGWAALGLAAAGVLALRLLRGLALPPLGWDGLTYHLVRAGRWVQAGDLAVQPAPDAWGYYQGYPTAADGLWALGMLGAHDDAWVPWTGAWAWAGAAGAVWLLARALGADRVGAALATVVLGLAGCVAGLLTNAYVDNVALAGSVLALGFFVRARWGDEAERRSPVLPALAVAAASVAAATKLPHVALLLALAAWTAWRLRAQPVRVAGLALGSGLLCVHYLRAWVVWGSPTWPVALAVGPLRFAGDPAYTAVLARDWGLGPTHLSSLVVGDLSLAEATAGGLAILPVAGLALAALRAHPAGGLVLLFAVAQALPLAHPATPALITFWAQSSGRLMSGAFAALAALAALGRGRVARGLLAAAAVLQLLQAWPALGDAVALGPMGAVAAIGGAAAVLGGLALRRGGPAGRAAAAAVALLAAAGWLTVRDRARLPVWSALPEGAVALDWHALVHPGTVAAPAWVALADAAPRRIAVAPGSDGYANQYWYLYPLMGRRLQHTLVYVPPSADGTVYPRSSAALQATADRDAWLARLLEERVDGVVLLPFKPLERAWIRELPQVFPPEALAADGKVGLWRVDAAAARAHLTPRR